MKKKYSEPKVLKLSNVKILTKAAGGIPAQKGGLTQDQGSHAS